MKQKYNVGDIVWHWSITWTGDLITCPVCNGTGHVLVKPVDSPDSDGHAYVCQACSMHPDTSDCVPGKIIDRWSHKPMVTWVRIDRVLMTTSAKETQYEYHFNVTSNSWNKLTEDQACATKEEAQQKAEAAANAANLKADQQRYGLCVNTDRTVSWSVRAHLRSIKDLQLKLDYHKRMLGLCREKRKTSTTG